MRVNLTETIIAYIVETELLITDNNISDIYRLHSHMRGSKQHKNPRKCRKSQHLRGFSRFLICKSELHFVLF